MSPDAFTIENLEAKQPTLIMSAKVTSLRWRLIQREIFAYTDHQLGVPAIPLGTMKRRYQVGDDVHLPLINLKFDAATASAPILPVARFGPLSIIRGANGAALTIAAHHSDVETDWDRAVRWAWGEGLTFAHNDGDEPSLTTNNGTDVYFLKPIAA